MNGTSSQPARASSPVFSAIMARRAFFVKAGLALSLFVWEGLRDDAANFTDRLVLLCKKHDVPFPRPYGAIGNDAQKTSCASHLRIFVVRCKRMKFYTQM